MDGYQEAHEVSAGPYIPQVRVPSLAALLSVRRLLRWILYCLELGGACFMVLAMSAIRRKEFTTSGIAIWAGQRLFRICDCLRRVE